MHLEDKRSNVSVIEYDFTLDQTKFADRIDALGNSWFRIIKSPYESNNSFGYGIHIPIGEKEFSKVSTLVYPY